jgi:hypothetical protein
MDLAFSVPVSVTKNWHFPALVFCFFRRRCSGGAGYLFGLVFVELLPFVGRRVLGRAERQAEQIGLAPISIAGAAWFGDFHKTERDDFANGRPDSVAVDAVSHEVVIGHRQSAVVGTAMIGEFDLDAVQDATG